METEGQHYDNDPMKRQHSLETWFDQVEPDYHQVGKVIINLLFKRCCHEPDRQDYINLLATFHSDLILDAQTKLHH